MPQFLRAMLSFNLLSNTWYFETMTMCRRKESKILDQKINQDFDIISIALPATVHDVPRRIALLPCWGTHTVHGQNLDTIAF